MICCTSLFTSITTTVTYQVKLPNDQDVPVTHIGVVRLSEHLVLTHVLCVPSFNFNLLSAKYLTQHHSCCLIFLSNACFFQDLASWTMIGMGEVRPVCTTFSGLGCHPLLWLMHCLTFIPQLHFLPLPLLTLLHCVIYGIIV
jgi:hypothetical protein